MRINEFGGLVDCKCLFVLLLIYISVTAGSSRSVAEDIDIDGEAGNFTAFQKALVASDDRLAMSVGNSLFSQLEGKYRGDGGFGALKSKLRAAEFLARQMESQLSKATGERMLAVTDELFGEKSKEVQGDSFSTPPAKRFYETSLGLFSKRVGTSKFLEEERNFLAQFYDMNLRILTNSIAKAGQALAIAEPRFKGTHDYVLVLPLLHVSDKNSINIDILPRWMRQPGQLKVFSNSCLLHFGFPFHAMMFAKEAARIQGESFSEIDFYRSASKKCGNSYPHIAADCLSKAISYVSDREPDMVVGLQFEMVQLWLDSRSYTLAAGQVRKIFEVYPDHKESGKAIWLYHYALSRNNNVDAILLDIDKAINDNRCEAYKARLMYTKWWALRRKRDETGRVAVLEYELLKQYGNDPMVAPVLLSRSTDLLAKGDYNGAYATLAALLEKFPSTKAAAQANKMLVRLKKMSGMK